MSRSVTLNSAPLVGFAWTLGLVFLVLKLTHTIAWPWLWVLAPFWIPGAIWLAAALLVGIGIIVLAIIGTHRRRQPAPQRHFTNPAYRSYR